MGWSSFSLGPWGRCSDLQGLSACLVFRTSLTCLWFPDRGHTSEYNSAERELRTCAAVRTSSVVGTRKLCRASLRSAGGTKMALGKLERPRGPAGMSVERTGDLGTCRCASYKALEWALGLISVCTVEVEPPAIVS